MGTEKAAITKEGTKKRKQLPKKEGKAKEEPREEIICGVATEFKPGKVTWLWKERISMGGITFLDGEPGLGKSSILFDVAARVTKGRKMPDGSTGAKGPVIFLLGEDDASTLAIPRLKAAGADLKKVHFFGQRQGSRSFGLPTFPGACESLATIIKRHGAKLVVLDPFMSFFPPGLSPYIEHDVRQVLGPVGIVSQETGCSICCIRHPTKNTSAKKIYRGGGSIGITACARTVLWVGEHPQEQEKAVLSVIKTNLARKPEVLIYAIEARGNSSGVNWLGPLEASEDDPVSAAEMLGKRIVFDEAIRLLQEALKNGPKPAKILLREADDSGIGKRTLCDAKASLGVLSTRKKAEDGSVAWEWHLPKK